MRGAVKRVGRLNDGGGSGRSAGQMLFGAFSLAFLCGLCLLLNGCGEGARESLSDCEDAETGYVLVLENSGLDCERASIILGLIGSAEHGVQKIGEPDRGAWLCEAFPERPGAAKYACRKGKLHFFVRAPGGPDPAELAGVGRTGCQQEIDGVTAVTRTETSKLSCAAINDLVSSIPSEPEKYLIQGDSPRLLWKCSWYGTEQGSVLLRCRNGKRHLSIVKAASR